MKHIIFDFDGTLVNSMPVVLEIADEVTGGIELSKRDIEDLRDMSAREIIKESGVPVWKLPALLLKGKALLGKRLNELKTFPGMIDAVEELTKSGHVLSVVSSNSEPNIRKVLKNEGIERHFSGVYGNVGLFNKARVIKVAIRDQHATAADTIYIGDEVRDIEGARKGKVPIISVTWGYNSKRIIEAYKPDFVAEKPKDISNIITQLGTE